FLTGLADAKTLKRAELGELAEALAKQHKPKTAKLARWTDAASRLSAKAKPLAVQAGKHLSALLGDVPDDSLAVDWNYLCREMAKDLKSGAPTALAKLAAVRQQVVQAARARVVEVGSKANQGALAGDLEALARALPAGTAAAVAAASDKP